MDSDNSVTFKNDQHGFSYSHGSWDAFIPPAPIPFSQFPVVTDQGKVRYVKWYGNSLTPQTPLSAVRLITNAIL